MDNNVYLLTSRNTGRQILIDAADDPAAIGALLGEAGADGPEPGVDLIITTHSHWDHLRALAEMARQTGARLVAGQDDVPDVEAQAGVEGVEGLAHLDQIGVDGIQLGVVHLRGHTPGSVALVYEEAGEPAHAFTGDSLFPGGVGNTWGDQARFRQLIGDVSQRLFGVHPDSTRVHPGHGAGTTLGAERPMLEAWAARGW
jgi:glyoxylase-like metal-dependent hydrolase (beta-lactamase superfamily II)